MSYFEALTHIFWDVNIYEQVAHQWNNNINNLNNLIMSIIREKWLFFSLLGLWLPNTT